MVISLSWRITGLEEGKQSLRRLRERRNDENEQAVVEEWEDWRYAG